MGNVEPQTQEEDQTRAVCVPLFLLVVLLKGIHTLLWKDRQSNRDPGYTSWCCSALSPVRLCTLWTAAHQVSLSFTTSRSWLKLMSIESMIPSNHHILSCPLLLPSVFPNIRVFSSELAVRVQWSKY